MASRNYQLFRRAIMTRRQITCTYQGFYREVCPHILGHKHGREVALTFQFAGQSRSGLPAKGEWRCLSLAEVHDVQIREGGWYSGPRHTVMQACVDTVDIDVNR
jgi:hypothetical protein